MDIISLTSDISGQLLIVNINKIVVVFRKTSNSAAFSEELTTEDKNGKGTGCQQARPNCPPCILFLEQGLELMREAGEPMEYGIFDFYKVFSRAFGEEEDGAGGS